MPKIYESRIFRFTQKQLFDLVLDIESYPEFLPLCRGAKIISQGPEGIIASLTISAAGLEKTYQSLVTSTENTISAKAIDGPFKYLHNHWKFTPLEEGAMVECTVDFELESFLLSKLMDVLLSKVYQETLAAFEQRAEHQYGNKNSSN